MTTVNSKSTEPYRKLKVALLVNIIAPYRLPVYQTLADAFDLSIFHGALEGNRQSWKKVGSQLKNATVKESLGYTIKFKKRQENSVYDYKFLHITPGFFFDLLQFRPDAVITNEMGFRTLMALLYATLFQIPIWIWSGGTCHTEQGLSWAKRFIRTLIVKWSHRWISYGNEATDYLISLGVKRNAIVQIQNCVDENLFVQPREAIFNIEPKPVFLYVGQLIMRKGVDKLLEAAACLQQENYDFSLLLVGGGAEKEFLEQKIQELCLKNVVLYEPQPPEVMPQIYRSADYLVFPTLEDIWGLVVNEALWSGLPVLASKYAGCASEILPQENVFDPLELSTLVTAMKRSLEGDIAKPDLSRLLRYSEVSDRIINDIDKQLVVNEKP